ncbi:MAG: glycosyltransferase family 2 protein [bacterium]
MNNTIKKGLLLFSLLYLTACIIAGLEVSRALHSFFVNFFITLAIFLIVRQAFLLLAAILKKIKDRTARKLHYTQQPMITILMPAYNEENVIIDALESIVTLNYSNYEVIVIDDGSMDNTSSLVSQYINDKVAAVPVRLISQSNAGKANALNTGLIHANGDFILAVDADAKLNKDCLLYGVQNFKDDRMGAVAGNVIVVNEYNWLTRFQQLEYLVSQNVVRQGLALFGIVPIVPGPIGLFRKSAMLEAYGYREDSKLFAEDADLSIRLLQLGWKITSDERMCSATEAPSDLFTLLRQRYRWKRGIFQALNDNFTKLILSPDLKRPLLAIFLIFETFLLEVLGFGITLFMLANIIYTFSFHLLPIWLAVLITLDVMALLLAVPIKYFTKWLPILLLQKISYTYALQAWGMLALIDEWRATEMSWDKLDRIGIANKGSSS